VGDAQEQQWPNARNGKRRRTCVRFIIPSKAFVKYWESMGKPDPETIGSTGMGKPDPANAGTTTA
jgi:hypothetical protein